MYPYEDLEKHFTAPKRLSPFYKENKIPRKMKKAMKKNHVYRNFLTLNQKLWHWLDYTNPDYKRFLIKQILK